MNDRQYFRSSIGELEAVVKNNWDSLDSLHAVARELNFRRMPRASWLQYRVGRRIKKLAQAGRRQSELKAKRAEASGLVNRIRANSASLQSLIEKTVRDALQKHLDLKAAKKAEVAKKRSLAQIARREREAEIKAKQAGIERNKQEAIGRLYLGGAPHLERSSLTEPQLRQVKHTGAKREVLTGLSSRKTRCRHCSRLAVPGSDTCYSCS
jgi:hypothetical protein